MSIRLSAGVASITREEARLHPDRNLVTHVIGIDTAPECFQNRLVLKSGDLLLLCSDGLFRELAPQALAATLGWAPPNEAARALVEQACEHGGRDNVTVVVASVEG